MTKCLLHIFILNKLTEVQAWRFTEYQPHFPFVQTKASDSTLQNNVTQASRKTIAYTGTKRRKGQLLGTPPYTPTDHLAYCPHLGDIELWDH